VLAPVCIALALARAPGWSLAAALAIGFLSDVFDGIVARRGDAATPGLRRLDSVVDTIFYLAVAYAVSRLHPAVIRAYGVAIACVIAAELLNYAAAFARFRREASYHAWSAKAWGVLLFVALELLLAIGEPRAIPVALVVALLSQLETLAITLTLPAWDHDVPSVWHALAKRRQVVAPGSI
jgi:CDP-diacylglycerol--glycerol-3-phosphate 3-phosphatidyltransferase